MTDTLDKVFFDFGSLAQTKLQRKGTSRLKARMVYLNETIELRSKVDELEKATQFQRLLDTTFSVFSSDAYHSKNKSFWAPAVRNFFRQSGLYIDIFEGKDVSIDSLIVKYREAFQRRQIRRTYLVPLGGVRFSDQRVDCGSFQIQRFTSGELATIFNNRARKVFYEWTAVSTDQLQEYWFLFVTKEVPARKLRSVGDWSYFDLVEVEYTNYPIPVQEALQLLATYHWQADHEKEKGWLGPNVPVVVHVDDDLLADPGPAPDLSLFKPWIPISGMVIDPETGEHCPIAGVKVLKGISGMDIDQVSEEIGEEPVFWIDLDEQKTEAFKTMMQRLAPIMSAVRARQGDWPFVQVALGFFVKAFFSKGLEQLLWHITALEALLAKGREPWERVGDRLAVILERDEACRKAIRNDYKALYDFRSDLVHGNTKITTNKVQVGHLSKARNFARQALIWFLYYLKQIEDGLPPSPSTESIPTREDVLAVLDLDPNARARLGSLIKNLPTEFPYAPEWCSNR